MSADLKERILANVEFDTNGGCWLWAKGINKAGYGRLCRDGGVHLAHRESFSTFVGDPGGLLVCHKCDTPACVNPSHLFAGTSADNGGDMSRKGRATKNLKLKGSGHGNSKLTEPKVLEIRARAKEPFADLAKEFGVSSSTIEKVVYRSAWNHV